MTGLRESAKRSWTLCARSTKRRTERRTNSSKAKVRAISKAKRVEAKDLEKIREVNQTEAADVEQNVRV